MRRHSVSGGVALLALAIGGPTADTARPTATDGSKVEVVQREAERRVDVLIDGQPFTSYIYPETLKKPVLYPLRTARGTVVTRGYPLDPRPGERTDHPHHVGMWFNYGDVNGIDFWNNSEAVKPDRAPKMGTIVHREIKRAAGGTGRGELDVTMDWVFHDGTVILREDTRHLFHAVPNARMIDRLTTLTALEQPVEFGDSKEGVLGIRVARALEEPSDRPEVLVGPDGKASSERVVDNTGVNGVYHSSEGKRGGAVWGTRGRWVSLSGRVPEEEVTLVILDHPANPGFPTYWHARGYGLFAANPLGQAEFSEGRERLGLALKPGESVQFKHRVLILSGSAAPNEIEQHYERWASKEGPTAD
jgi:hypothetical protein